MKKEILFETVDGTLLVTKFNLFKANSLCDTKKERKRICDSMGTEFHFVRKVLNNKYF